MPWQLMYTRFSGENKHACTVMQMLNSTGFMLKPRIPKDLLQGAVGGADGARALLWLSSCLEKTPGCSGSITYLPGQCWRVWGEITVLDQGCEPAGGKSRGLRDSRQARKGLGLGAFAHVWIVKGVEFCPFTQR